MEINIPENPEKGKTSLWNKLFVPIVIILVGIGGFGIGKLSKIEESRKPVTINYLATTTPATSTTSVSKEKIEATSSETVTSGQNIRRVYVAARGGTVYYLPTCAAANRIAEKNKIWFSTKEEAERMGYKPAQNCKGL